MSDERPQGQPPTGAARHDQGPARATGADVPGDGHGDLDARTGRSAAAMRIAHQHQYVDQQIRVALRRGDFDDLPGAGKPIDLGTPDDRDWWLKKLVERERITGVLPAALQLRKDDALLADELDRLPAEREVRERLADFNRRVVEARRQLEGGPPVITATRDVEAEVQAWHQRRLQRRLAAQAASAEPGHTGRPPPARKRSWGRPWRRWGRPGGADS